MKNKEKIFVIIIIFIIQTHASYQCDTTYEKGKDTIVVCTTKTDSDRIVGIEGFRNGKSDGLYRRWYKNGQLEYIKKYDKGCARDTAYGYFSNGNLKSLIPYKHCKREGLRVIFSQNGDTLAKGNAHNGKSIGTHYAWYPNKNKKFITTYNSTGQKHGLSQTWREDGTKKDSIVFHNDTIIEARYYYTTGKLRYHLIEGINDSTIHAVFFNPAGKKSGTVKNGNGTYIVYSDDATYAEKRTVENGRIVKKEVYPVAADDK